MLDKINNECYSAKSAILSVTFRSDSLNWSLKAMTADIYANDCTYMSDDIGACVLMVHGKIVMLQWMSSKGC
jgi:hypothetical protein